jgi:hypothetical protein
MQLRCGGLSRTEKTGSTSDENTHIRSRHDITHMNRTDFGIPDGREDSAWPMIVFLNASDPLHKEVRSRLPRLTE